MILPPHVLKVHRHPMHRHPSFHTIHVRYIVNNHNENNETFFILLYVYYSGNADLHFGLLFQSNNNSFFLNSMKRNDIRKF